LNEQDFYARTQMLGFHQNMHIFFTGWHNWHEL